MFLGWWAVDAFLHKCPLNLFILVEIVGLYNSNGLMQTKANNMNQEISQSVVRTSNFEPQMSAQMAIKSENQTH